jgi:hypothetical protein
MPAYTMYAHTMTPVRPWRNSSTPVPSDAELETHRGRRSLRHDTYTTQRHGHINTHTARGKYEARDYTHAHKTHTHTQAHLAGLAVHCNDVVRVRAEPMVLHASATNA